MNKRIFFFAFAFLATSLALPHFAHAAAIPFLGPIIDQSWTVSSTGIQCALGWGAVLMVVNNVIRFLVTIAVVFVAPIMIAYAGFLYVVNSMNPSGISKAKGILLNTIIGIIIALAGYLIVDAVMAVLTTKIDGSTTFAHNWASLITSGSAPTCLPQKGVGTELNQSTNGGAGIATVSPNTNCAALYSSTLPSIAVSATGDCCDKTKSNCTSLEGMLFSTTQQIININSKCGPIIVSGGTEVGHSSEGSPVSHSGGAKVDIKQNLISCITKTEGSVTVDNPKFGSAQVKDRCGNVYTWEGNHTDIYVQKVCPL